MRISDWSSDVCSSDLGAEGGDLDDLAAEHHVRQAETAADQAAVAEQVLDLFRRGAGGDVEVLGMAADHQVAHGAADQEGLVAAFAQAVEHAQRIGTDVLARNRMLVPRDDPQGDRKSTRLNYSH